MDRKRQADHRELCSGSERSAAKQRQKENSCSQSLSGGARSVEPVTVLSQPRSVEPILASTSKPQVQLTVAQEVPTSSGSARSVANQSLCDADRIKERSRIITNRGANSAVAAEGLATSGLARSAVADGGPTNAVGAHSAAERKRKKRRR